MRKNSEDNAITIEKATFNGHCFLDLFPSGGKTTNPTLKIMSNVSMVTVVIWPHIKV